MENNNDSNNIVGKGSLLKGNLNVPGNIRLEGKVVGNVKSKSKIACGETCVIEGNLIAQNAEIAGKVNGKVKVSELLILKSSCIINGDISTEKLIIESGSTFNGGCVMGENLEKEKIKKKSKEPEDNDQKL